MHHKKRISTIAVGLLSIIALLAVALLFKLTPQAAPVTGSGELADVSILREDEDDQGNRTPSPSPTETTGSPSPSPATSPTSTPGGQEVPETGDNDMSLWLALGGLCLLALCLVLWGRRARGVNAG